eukprot:CAMPEP_0117678416 /NCGR_PEP_ID=MMETSP0804-20121206/17285_1 /TAXON_ID=1074897 /ORGANISM="Tetraselmis astigmatica, Strain CCMP880" /LENGTH=732 /DNA_ID=CAMNT_0005487801 /DNA_START=198 /DNA_END=2396 /DNA_ORIENTATION=+
MTGAVSRLKRGHGLPAAAAATLVVAGGSLAAALLIRGRGRKGVGREVNKDGRQDSGSHHGQSLPELEDLQECRETGQAEAPAVAAEAVSGVEQPGVEGKGDEGPEERQASREGSPGPSTPDREDASQQPTQDQETQQQTPQQRKHEEQKQDEQKQQEEGRPVEAHAPGSSPSFKRGSSHTATPERRASVSPLSGGEHQPTANAATAAASGKGAQAKAAGPKLDSADAPAPLKGNSGPSEAAGNTTAEEPRPIAAAEEAPAAEDQGPVVKDVSATSEPAKVHEAPAVVEAAAPEPAVGQPEPVVVPEEEEGKEELPSCPEAPQPAVATDDSVRTLSAASEHPTVPEESGAVLEPQGEPGSESSLVGGSALLDLELPAVEQAADSKEQKEAAVAEPDVVEEGVGPKANEALKLSPAGDISEDSPGAKGLPASRSIGPSNGDSPEHGDDSATATGPAGSKKQPFSGEGGMQMAAKATEEVPTPDAGLETAALPGAEGQEEETEEGGLTPDPTAASAAELSAKESADDNGGNDNVNKSVGPSNGDSPEHGDDSATATGPAGSKKQPFSGEGGMQMAAKATEEVPTPDAGLETAALPGAEGQEEETEEGGLTPDPTAASAAELSAKESADNNRGNDNENNGSETQPDTPKDLQLAASKGKTEASKGSDPADPSLAPASEPSKAATAASTLAPETAAALKRATKARAAGKKVKPNDPCPCGRFYPPKKYKKCCGKGGL